MKCAKLLTALVCITATARALALEIPLTVTERAGVDRAGNHVNAGLPFAKGTVTDVAKLGLFTGDGKTILPAAFVVRQKWQDDNSIRWATVHFITDVAANAQAKYVVKDVAGAAPSFPVTAKAAGDMVTVDTGAIKFTVAKENFNVFNEVWFDASGKGVYGQPVVPAGAAKLVANMVSGDYKVVNTKATVNQVTQPFSAGVKLNSLEIEEQHPCRAVVKASGQFTREGTPTIDFVVRIYAISGSAAVRVAFTIINRTGSAWNTFYGFNELSLNIPVKLGDGLKYTMATSEGAPTSGTVKAGEYATVLQPYSEHYFLSGVASGQGKAKSLLTRRLGWIDLTGSKAGVVAGMRYFWQLHPKGLTVSGDGTVSLQIVPRQETKAVVPANIVSQADTRIDLFTGGARTHELLFACHAPDANTAAIGTGITDPLSATCPTSWYCQDTKAEGLLWDANPENFKPEYRDLIAAFQKKANDVFNECAGPARRGGKRGTEEYGFFSFGVGSESKGPTFITPNDWLNTRWDGNYYDFPRAVLVNFWRTGDLRYWDVAQDATLHLADIDIAHANPGNPNLAGIEHVCPNRGHFRQFWGSEPFGISGNMDSSKSQSIYDLYHMTGDAWFLDCALLVANYNMNHTGGALRAIGNRGKNLVEAFEQTGDKKYWDESVAWLMKSVGTRGPKRSWDQYWMYGLPSEPMMDIYRRTGDIQMAQAIVDCCDSLINVHWIPEKQSTRDLNGFTTICFGNAYELTGMDAYFKKGISMLKATSEEYAGGTKSFAQQFRISPYFLHYLTKDYKTPKAVIEKTNAEK